jgi:hypothetical protein
MVVPLILEKIPAEVVHRSPLTGVVGAAPWGRFNPAVVVVDAIVFSFPAEVTELKTDPSENLHSCRLLDCPETPCIMRPIELLMLSILVL